ncbi:hypothetical protein SAMN05443245_6915 [Paraburkholderia fungorum]|uniref:Beta-xylosidase n=1 Tax=Paraburkholderia fungorum TaxID=134537 RepID=A0A1H1JMZ6_9BURK|nr:hypothetical protein SAMN05443245_6915 [Paraburkholderia fungorum]
MKVAKSCFLACIFLVASSSSFSQGMNGGAAEAKGAKGTSNSNGERATLTSSQSSDPTASGHAQKSTRKKNTLAKSRSATPASAANSGSGGS